MQFGNKTSPDSYLLLLVASLARDLDGAGLLSGTSRKTIHDGLAELRSAVEAEGGSNSAALTILDNIPHAGSD